MDKKLIKIVNAAFCLVLVLLPASSVTLAQSTEEPIGEQLSDALKNKIERGNYFLKSIDSQISNSQEELELLKTNKSKLKAKINESKVDVTNLQSQLDNLDELIQSHKDKIEAISLLISRIENQVSVQEQNVKDTQTYLDVYVKLLDQALSAYYFHANDFFEIADSDPKLLAFLAYSDTTGEVVRENEYLMSLQKTTQDLANEIIRVQSGLDVKKVELQNKLITLDELKELLASQKRNVIAAQESKKRLLAQTQGKQLIYETLLELSEKEETQVSLQITRLKDNFSFFQTKLDELKQNPDAKGFDFNSLSLEESVNPIAASLRGSSNLAWPISPALGITAYFRDASYKAALGVEHNAVDIRLPQGSQVRSSGDGVVTKAADNGMAYSYIIIAHPDNFLTLYGHMSDIFVKEGEIVKQGEIIGLSGGMPGTKGAGWLTTGPHLHLEVFKDWKHVDPLDYLPLELLPVSSLPEKYLNKVLGEKERRLERPTQ